MRYRILVRRLLLWEKRYITSKELKELCVRLKLPYYDALMYLYSNKYVMRIMRGFFYIPTAEARRLNTGKPSIFEAISKAMDYKGVKNWYFGLESAIKLNAITHEVFTIDFVVSDTIFRPKPIEILGHRVKFVKLNKKLFGFGVKKTGFAVYSDLEKTILDLIHLRKYAGASNRDIRDELIEWVDEANKSKMKKYSNHYSKSVRMALEELK